VRIGSGEARARHVRRSTPSNRSGTTGIIGIVSPTRERGKTLARASG
jgi:hypothetical protein